MPDRSSEHLQEREVQRPDSVSSALVRTTGQSRSHSPRISENITALKKCLIAERVSFSQSSGAHKIYSGKIMHKWMKYALNDI